MALTLNQKVVVWTSGQVGKSIGAGECWDLADRALKQAGAGSSADFGPTGDDADYVWGTEVPDLKDAQPGDILQYRDYLMTTKTTIEVTFEDDYGYESWSEATDGRPHHTAIVATTPGNGALTVLEQNHRGNHENVRSTALRFTDAPAKVTRARQLTKRKDNGKMQMATVITTVEVSVSGTLKAYRPTTN